MYFYDWEKMKDCMDFNWKWKMNRTIENINISSKQDELECDFSRIIQM